MRVKAGSAAVRGTVALSARLHPDKGILKRIASVGGGSNAEAGALNVTPITPCLLSSGLNSVARCVHDEVSWEAGGGEKRGEGVDISFLVAVRIALSVRGAGRGRPGVVVGNVSGETADGGGFASSSVKLSEKSCGGLDVGGPSEPSGVAGIEIHAHVGQIELLDGIGNALLVGICSIGTLLHAQICHQVGQAVGF